MADLLAQGAAWLEQQRTKHLATTVTYVRADDSETTISITGIDETTFAPGRISWTSPVARALMQRRVGDTVTVRTPSGPEQLEILTIVYPS